MPKKWPRKNAKMYSSTQKDFTLKNVWKMIFEQIDKIMIYF